MSGRMTRNRNAGFTLLELLAATAMFCILVGVLHNMLFGALNLRNTTFRAIEQALPRDQLALIIRRDLTNMVAPSGVLAGPITATPEEEQGVAADTINFFTTSGVVTELEPWGDVQQVEYRLEVPEDRDTDLGYDFVREVTRNLLPSSVEEEDDEMLLEWTMMRGVKSLEMLYWDGKDWQESWDSTTLDNANPEAVRLRIEFVNGDKDLEPEHPLEITCQIAAQPRATPSDSTVESSSGGSSQTGGDNRGGDSGEGGAVGPPGGAGAFPGGGGA